VAIADRSKMTRDGSEPDRESGATRQSGVTGGAGLSGLQSSLSRFASRGPAPVELWNPPYCGDIGLRIGADGTWYYRNSPIGRQALVRLFATVLRKDDDGHHYLVTPVEKILVEVEDAPFLAVSMEVSQGDRTADQLLHFTTNCGDRVSAGPEHPLRFEEVPGNEGIKPYILVRGRLEALLTRSLSYDLIALGGVHAVDGREKFGVWSAGVFFPITDAQKMETGVTA